MSEYKILDREIAISSSETSGNFAVILDLECPAGTQEREALLRFELSGDPGPLTGTGLMRSGNPRAAYFTYTHTGVGVVQSRSEVKLPDSIKCLSITLVPWVSKSEATKVRRVSIEKVADHATSESGNVFKTVRNISRFDCDVFQHESINCFFDAESLHSGLHVINCNGLPLEIMYNSKSAATTSIVFNAALGISTQEVPRFMAGPTFAGLKTNTISVFDACLYTDDSLMLAWYGGSAKFEMQALLPGLLQKFVTDAGGERTLLFGASGGGFAALFYSQFFPRSTVVAVNPQTILDNYLPRIVEAYARACWGAGSEEKAVEVLAARMCPDLRRLPDWAGHCVVYVQNSTDDHVDKHLLPFLTATRVPNLHLLMDKWGAGHVSPPKELIGQVLTILLNEETRWESLLGDLGSMSAPTENQIRERVCALGLA
ncbi:hypothetical protein IWX75_003209 [Arthrobacter sp. CAN_A6]|uniref:hypothetical protein n=1 Tax=Arthrobacter sp. CAN_A6 TaxID=2787721 RepID=UPI0018CB5B21